MQLSFGHIMNKIAGAMGQATAELLTEAGIQVTQGAQGAIFQQLQSPVAGLLTAGSLEAQGTPVSQAPAPTGGTRASVTVGKGKTIQTEVFCKTSKNGRNSYYARINDKDVSLKQDGPLSFKVREKIKVDASTRSWSDREIAFLSQLDTKKYRKMTEIAPLIGEDSFSKLLPDLRALQGAGFIDSVQGQGLRLTKQGVSFLAGRGRTKQPAAPVQEVPAANAAGNGAVTEEVYEAP